MQFGCGTMDVHLYLSIEPVTLGSYIYTVMSFTSQLTTKLGKAFANSSVSPALNHLLSHMQATSEAWGAVVDWVYGWTSCMWPRAQTQSIICILFGQGRRQWKPTRKTFLYSGQEICHKPIIRVVHKHLLPTSAFKWINMCFGTLPVVSKVHLFKASMPTVMLLWSFSST